MVSCGVMCLSCDLIVLEICIWSNLGSTLGMLKITVPVSNLLLIRTLGRKMVISGKNKTSWDPSVLETFTDPKMPEN